MNLSVKIGTVLLMFGFAPLAHVSCIHCYALACAVPQCILIGCKYQHNVQEA